MSHDGGTGCASDFECPLSFLSEGERKEWVQKNGRLRAAEDVAALGRAAADVDGRVGAGAAADNGAIGLHAETAGGGAAILEREIRLADAVQIDLTGLPFFDRPEAIPRLNREAAIVDAEARNVGRRAVFAGREMTAIIKIACGA